MTQRLKTVACFLLISMVSLLTYNSVQANEPISEFEQSMEEYRGKVVYLDFWASWCVPCRKSFPWMNTMQTKHKDKGLVVLSVNLDAQAILAEKFLQETPANFSIIYDAKGKLANKFQLKGMPSSYLFNRQGKLISTHNGFNRKKQQQYEQEIAQALSQ